MSLSDSLAALERARENEQKHFVDPITTKTATVDEVVAGVEQSALRTIGIAIPEGDLSPHRQETLPLAKLFPARIRSPEARTYHAILETQVGLQLKAALAREILARWNTEHGMPHAVPPSRDILADVKRSARALWGKELHRFDDLNAEVELQFQTRFAGKSLDDIQGYDDVILSQAVQQAQILVQSGYIYDPSRLDQVRTDPAMQITRAQLDQLLVQPLPIQDGTFRALMAHLECDQAARESLGRVQQLVYKDGTETEIGRKKTAFFRSEKRFEEGQLIEKLVDRLRGIFIIVQENRGMGADTGTNFRTLLQGMQRPPPWINSLHTGVGDARRFLNEIDGILREYPFSGIDRTAIYPRLFSLIEEAKSADPSVDFHGTVMQADVTQLTQEFSALRDAMAECLREHKKKVEGMKTPERLPAHHLLLLTNLDACRQDNMVNDTVKKNACTLSREALARTLLQELAATDTIAAEMHAKLADILTVQGKVGQFVPHVLGHTVRPAHHVLGTIARIFSQPDAAAWDFSTAMGRHGPVGQTFQKTSPFTSETELATLLEADGHALRDLSSLTTTMRTWFRNHDVTDYTRGLLLQSLDRLVLGMLLDRVHAHLADKLLPGVTDDRTIAAAVVQAEAAVREAIQKELEEARKAAQEEAKKTVAQKEKGKIPVFGSMTEVLHMIVDLSQWMKHR